MGISRITIKLMDSQKIAGFKKKLEDEKKLLEGELSTVSAVNPNNSDDWEPKRADLDIGQADRNEVADVIEEFGNNSAITHDLEIRLAEVRDALQKIEDGKYGICEISGEEIEEDRLNANPAARTCKEHLNEKI